VGELPSADDAQVDVLRPPERFNGHTVVLLHGKNFSGAYWEPTTSSLAGKGFRVVDQIGFGKSSKPHAYQFTFQALAENTNGLLDHLGVGACTSSGIRWVGRSARGSR